MAMMDLVVDEQQTGAAGKGVPTGFKLTEVGVIPEDWDVTSISEIATIRVGKDVDERRTSADLDNKYCYPVFSNTVDEPGIYGYYDYAEYFGNAVTVVGRGVGLGTAICRSGGFGAIGRLIVLFPKGNSIFLSNYINHAVDIFNESSGVPQLTGTALGQCKIAWPSLDEQTAIADTLSDVDTLIFKLEKKLVKKQAIKTATMQQLLTGKTRLPQFALRADGTVKGYKKSEYGEIPVDWCFVELGNLFEQTINRKTIDSTEEISFIGMQDVSDKAQLSTYLLMKKCDIKPGLTYFERGDVLVAKITPCFENGKGCYTQTLTTNIGYGSTEFHVLRAKPNADPEFIYYWTTDIHFRSTLKAEMVGSAGHKRVPFHAIQAYKIPCPENKEEQTAIAAILSDMDKDIQTLQQRLDKTRQLKQGMMQELLTGKTRLIERN